MRKSVVLGALVLSVALLGAAAEGSVPATSPGAGDGLDRFRSQAVNWTRCRDASLAASGTECARITVPLDYGRPRGRTIEVAVSRIASTDAARRRGILLTNPGGPAARGLGLPRDLRTVMGPAVTAAYDVVGMDTRGLGESTPVDCGLTRSTWLLHAPGPDRAGFEESVRRSRADARSCWERAADVLPHLSTRNIARDVDVVRGALGERRTSWFGQSYGAFLGASYAQMFPDRVDRLVLDSAPDPAEYPFRMVRRQGLANERALDDFAAWVAPRHRTYGLGATPAAVRTRAAQPVFGPMTHAPFPCAFWAEEPREPRTVIDNGVPALQIQATGDPRTTYRSGLRMHRALRASRLVTVPARAHTVYASRPNDCVRRTVNTYLVHGTLPARDTVCRD
ncbi:alpha/beta fold hydrolase [Streptomyces sp. NPDC059816]|uniref:alpha/beta fold hydrolase n=1 Tax=Streptomyces sp. NPDC059816 TaxID=3346960 RepID=UPI00365C8FB0